MTSVAIVQMVNRVEELGEELVRTVEDAQAQLHQERESTLAEFEAAQLQVHIEYKQRLLEADLALARAVEEREAYSDPGFARRNDVVTLNVGGRMYSVKRETLCMCQGSFMSDLFSGHWDRELQHDGEGNVFLDFDPAVFDLLLNWLRDKKIETPDRPAALPLVPQEDLCHFQAIVDYFGLREHLDLPGMTTDAWALLTSSAGNSDKEHSAQDGSGGQAVAPNPNAQGPQGPQSLLRGFIATIRESMAESMPEEEAAAPDTTADVAPEATATDPDLTLAGTMQRLQGSSTRPVGWSHRFAHPSARPGDGDDDVGTVRINDTRLQAGAAAVRATRGFQSGVHYWEILVRVVSDWSYVGFVGSDWGALTSPVGCAPHSWGVASNGSLFACDHEVGRLPRGYGDGSVVGILIQLEGQDRRCATVFLDEFRFDSVFTVLPETVYPAASNMRAPAEYVLVCGLEPPTVQDQHFNAEAAGD